MITRKELERIAAALGGFKWRENEYEDLILTRGDFRTAAILEHGPFKWERSPRGLVVTIPSARGGRVIGLWGRALLYFLKQGGKLVGMASRGDYFLVDAHGNPSEHGHDQCWPKPRRRASGRFCGGLPKPNPRRCPGRRALKAAVAETGGNVKRPSKATRAAKAEMNATKSSADSSGRNGAVLGDTASRAHPP